jgi:hypothetical protein
MMSEAAMTVIERVFSPEFIMLMCTS